MKLNELRENPNNPSKCTEEQLEKLAGKLKRVPLGLTAMRIAYVTDAEGGGKMVISGNKRLKVLKKAFGEDAELPDEYFQDVTAMSEAERHEFIVDANVSDGYWDVDMLLQQYDIGELESLLEDNTFAKLFGDDIKFADDVKTEEVEDKEQKIYSEVGKKYMLGENIVQCVEAKTCDKIRQLYVDAEFGYGRDINDFAPELTNEKN